MDWYHFFIFLYRASQHLSFGTGGRRECGAGNNWAGRGCGAWPPGAAEPKPRRGSTSAPPAIHTTGCGRARHPGQETAGIPTGRPPAGYSFPARPPPPATPRVLDAAQRRSGRSESPASAHLTCANSILPGLQVLGEPHGTARVFHGVRHCFPLNPVHHWARPGEDSPHTAVATAGLVSTSLLCSCSLPAIVEQRSSEGLRDSSTTSSLFLSPASGSSLEWPLSLLVSLSLSESSS